MHSRCGPPKFDQQDWSQFDFSRWHLDGVTLDAVSAAFAGLSEELFNSEEWRQHFQSTLPELEREALSFFKNHSQRLRDQKNTATEDFDKRIAAAQKRSGDFRKSVETAAVLPVVQASPNTFHLAVKATIEDIGLPGLAVQIMDPRNEKTALVQAITDRDGNVILTVPEEIAKEVDKHDAALEVLSPAGKTLAKLPGAVCARLNQVETKVVSLPDSPEIEPHKNAALEILSERETRVAILAARVETLKREREARLYDLDCRLEDNEAIISELEPKGDAPKPLEPESPQDVSPQAKPTRKESPSAPKRNRKKK
jgi:hypothetical protein